MNITYSASGTPEQVKQALMQQSRQQRVANPNSTALVSAVRDELAKGIANVPDNATITVTASVSVTISEPKAPKAPEPAVVETDTVAKPK